LAKIISLMNLSVGSTPLKIDWVVEWDRFFFEGENGQKTETSDKRRLNYSRLISPSMSSALSGSNSAFKTRDEHKGGIFYRDLVRGVGDNLHDADAYIRNTFPALSSRTLVSAKLRRKLMGDYFSYHLNDGNKNTLSKNDVNRLSRQTPLALYILLEAVAKSKGQRLGPVGSKIIGGTIINSVLASRFDARDGEAAWGEYFKSSLPKTMPELLEFMHQKPVNSNHTS